MAPTFFGPCLLVLVSIFTLQMQTATAAITKCEYDKACGCHTNEGYIDLTPFSKTDPYFITNGGPQHHFYWLPCKDFTKDDKTVGSLQYISEAESYDAGVHSKADSEVQDGLPVFKMVSEDNKRRSLFVCTCTDDFSVNFKEEKPDGTYKFDLKGKACCPTGSKSSGGGGLSAGSVLLIVVFALIIVYLVIGVTVQTAVRKAEGKERIPNVSFWTAVPGLIKDGFKFTFTCGKATGYSQV